MLPVRDTQHSLLCFIATRVPVGFRDGYVLREFIRVRTGHDGRDEVADFLDFFLALGGDEVEGDGLSGEQGSPRDAYFDLGAGPFAAVEDLHRELDQELVGGKRGALGGLFEPSPLLGGDPHVLVQGLFFGICHRFLSTSVPFRVKNGNKNLAVFGPARQFEWGQGAVGDPVDRKSSPGSGRRDRSLSLSFDRFDPIDSA